MSDADAAFASAQEESGACDARRFLDLVLVDRQRMPNDGPEP